jgi:Fur family ferric uptake transcriptional regulator
VIGGLLCRGSLTAEALRTGASPVPATLPQRRALAEVLDGEHVHLSAETIHSRAQARLPELSMSTVYNTLNELVAMGEILEVSVGAGARRYDPNVSVAHHHLVCTGCGSLRDVRPGEAHAEALRPEEAYGFEITGVDIVFRGLCPECRARTGRRI